MAQVILKLQRLRTSYPQHSFPWTWGFLSVEHYYLKNIFEDPWHLHLLQSVSLSTAAITWLKNYCQYGVKLCQINQSINLSNVSSGLLSRDANIQPSACKASMEKWNHKVDQNIKQYQEIKFVDYLFIISHPYDLKWCIIHILLYRLTF